MSVTSQPVPHRATFAVCRFYIKTPAGDGQFTYESVELGSSQHDGRLRTTRPPLPGDLIFLWDGLKGEGGQFRVIERSWRHASWGSTYWPYIEMLPTEGPSVDVIVEADEGPFRDEAPVPDKDEG